MAYTHIRLRNTIAIVRIGFGLLFIDMGWYKVNSVQFARVDFPQFLYDAIGGSAIDFYAGFLSKYVLHTASRWAVGIGFLELTLGVALVLGALTRLVSLVGMFYMVNLALATWYQPAPGEPLYHFPDEQIRHAVPFLIFLILGIGHAGENLGLGSWYHRKRHKQWEKNWEVKIVPGLPSLQPKVKVSPRLPEGKPMESS